MDTDRAETYLRLLSEREIRDRTDLARLRQAAAVLMEAGALDDDRVARIVHSAELAVAVRTMGDDDVPPLAFRVPYGPFEPASAAGPWEVTPVGRTMAGRTGAILISALVRTPDAVFLAATRPSGDPIPLDDIVSLSATDDAGATYTLVRSGPAAIEFDPPLAPGVRSLTIFDLHTERVQLHPSATPPAPEPVSHQAVDSAAEQLLHRYAESLLVATARGSQIRPRRTAQYPFSEIVPVLLDTGLLSPESQVPAQLAALCEQLGLPVDGLPSPVDLPETWRSVITQCGRLHPQPARHSTSVTPLAIPLPDLDGLRFLLTGLCGSNLQAVVQATAPQRSAWTLATWSHGPRPVASKLSGPPVSAWARDDSGVWHLAAPGEVRFEPRHSSLALQFYPPLGRDVAELELTVTGRITSTNATISVRD